MKPIYMEIPPTVPETLILEIIRNIKKEHKRAMNEKAYDEACGLKEALDIIKETIK